MKKGKAAVHFVPLDFSESELEVLVDCLIRESGSKPEKRNKR